MTLNYYEEKKYCSQCDDYVRYLMNLDASYCVACGAKVQLFSQKDRARFLRALQDAKSPPRRGQTRKNVS